ncbi:hypothetical protein RHGRI_001214 [Rhododendron griersonianum]|uniref:Uncharacterized protein n=1 Tax=Rhododendron griersonianum TaxID=479676 RepID=A0AAV6LJD3_9ERIC|nr:hypothetical protein RHGRI_001214 [Rhododendron griersonianum]
MNSFSYVCTFWWRSQLMWRVFFTSAIVAVVVPTAMGRCKSGKCGHFGSGGFIIWDISGFESELYFCLLQLQCIVWFGLAPAMTGVSCTGFGFFRFGLGFFGLSNLFVFLVGRRITHSRSYSQWQLLEVFLMVERHMNNLYPPAGALFNQLTRYITYWRRNYLHKKGNRFNVCVEYIGTGTCIVAYDCPVNAMIVIDFFSPCRLLKCSPCPEADPNFPIEYPQPPEMYGNYVNVSSRI